MKGGWFGVVGGAALLLTAGCHLLQMTPGGGSKPLEREVIAGAPGKYSQRVAPYVFLADFELQRNAPIYVYLFEDKARYEQFMKLKYPELPARRAFFVAQPRRLSGSEELMVFTYRGERLQQDLRHELTHALLHSVLKDVPLWLDEGLAEYYEVPPANSGVNFHHLDQLCRPKQGQPKPNLSRLEQFSEVQQMNPGEYREAWAWVHFMLRGQPQGKQVLLQYLQELRSNSRPGPLEPRLAAALLSPHEALDRHLADLDNARRAATAQK